MSSLVLNMVGGGGGLAATDALLRVQAPAGSTVTITKGGVTKSDAGHENADDNSVYDYYFIIHQSQFDSVNPWTVTATLNGESVSDTIIVDSADEYNIDLGFHYLYKGGTYSSIYTHGSIQSNATVTNEATYIQQSQTGAGYYAYERWQAVDLTNYSTITFEGSAYDAGSVTNGVVCYVFVTQNSGVTLGKNATLYAEGDIGRSSDYVDFTLTLDVSSLTGNWYVAAGHDSTGQSWGGSRRCRVKSVKLE